MDIAALSSSMSYSRLQMNVGYAVAAKAMDQVEQTSAELLEMLEAAIPSDLGQHIDIRA
ncbi:MAG: putative motility protein [Lachnospiraceae bacterium]|uniref:YjfB family protein n=1 Tax=Candidatus Merdisoma sp. JLR.KK006 TaxID=3112626 RepID=UPI002FEFD52F|nr:putative motility protein [Lachnospiraceae bacterium]